MGLVKKRRLTIKKVIQAVDPTRRSRRFWFWLGFGVVVLVTGMLWAVWYVTRLPSLTISEVTAVGGSTIAPAKVVALVQAELMGSYYALVPKQFRYLYPKQAIKQKLRALSRLETATLTFNTTNHLHVTFTEYVPWALWCDKKDECALIDKRGYAFAKAPTLRGGAFLRYQTTKAPTPGLTGVPPAVLAASQEFISAVAPLKLRVRRVWFDDRDIFYSLGSGGEIKTSRADPVATTVANLQTLLADEAFAHFASGTFAYIDLRYGNKLFVKEREEVSTPVPTPGPE